MIPDKLDQLAKKAQREYKRKWNQENREHINRYAREWRKKNPDKVKEYNQRYWRKKALEMLKEQQEDAAEVGKTRFSGGIM